MKDKFKTLILLVLFAISIFLSKGLWIGDFKEAQQADKKMEDIDIKRNLIRPYKVLLNFSRKNHGVSYSKNQLWDKSKDYIIEGFTNKGVEIEELSQEDYGDLINKKSIIFHFPQKVNSYFLIKSLDIDNSNKLVEKVERLEYIYLSLYGKEAYLVLVDGDKYYKVSGFEADRKDIVDELRRLEKEKHSNYYSARDSMDIDSQLYIAYKIVETYPNIYINSGNPASKLKLARANSEAFFKKDIDYIREVVEDNGSILHIYDQEVLKYLEDGSLEYFNPLQETVKERNLSISLQTASEFLKKHIIGKDELYLSNIKEIEFKGNLGYRFIFRYNFEGVDLLELEGKSDHVYIDVYNKYVQSYRKHLNTSISREEVDQEAIAPFDILNENYDIFREDFLENYGEEVDEYSLTAKVFEDFEDISLYYINIIDEGKSVLKPIWLFKNSTREYMFDFYSGELIYKRRID